MDQKRVFRLLGIGLMIPGCLYVISHISWLKILPALGDSPILVPLMKLLWYPFIYTDALRFYIGDITVLAIMFLFFSRFTHASRTEEGTQ